MSLNGPVSALQTRSVLGPEDPNLELLLMDKILHYP